MASGTFTQLQAWQHKPLYSAAEQSMLEAVFIVMAETTVQLLRVLTTELKATVRDARTLDPVSCRNPCSSHSLRMGAEYAHTSAVVMPQVRPSPQGQPSAHDAENACGSPQPAKHNACLTRM